MCGPYEEQVKPTGNLNYVVKRGEGISREVIITKRGLRIGCTFVTDEAMEFIISEWRRVHREGEQV